MFKVSSHLLRQIFLTCVAIFTAQITAQEAIQDPIPELIADGDISVSLQPFLQFPRTQDTGGNGLTTDAFARIQYMLPVPGESKRLAVNDMRGILYFTDESASTPSVYLDLRGQDIGFFADSQPNEMGLMGFAFHPHFATAGTLGFGKFYTSHSATLESGIADYLEDSSNDHESVVMEWTSNDPSVNVFSGTKREIFRIGQFDDTHSIGSLAFNPSAEPGDSDFGILYFSLGDGGGANDPMQFGQSLATPMAGIVRIDPKPTIAGRSYSIPSDNPFAMARGAAPEIWAYGLRHPQHFSFASDGTMYISDIGQTEIEEVNIGIAGANYGWRLREGTFATAFAFDRARPNTVYNRPADRQEFVYPVAQYDHLRSHAISSGFLYEGSIIPALENMFVFSDMVTGHIYYIDADKLETDVPATIQKIRILFDGEEVDYAADFGYPNTFTSGNRSDTRLGVDSNGELYVLSKGDGAVRRLTAP